MIAVLDTPVAVRRTAMDLLARREHGRVELTRKLRQRGACPDMIDAALDRLPARRAARIASKPAPTVTARLPIPAYARGAS